MRWLVLAALAVGVWWLFFCRHRGADQKNAVYVRRSRNFDPAPGMTIFAGDPPATGGNNIGPAASGCGCS